MRKLDKTPAAFRKGRMEEVQGPAPSPEFEPYTNGRGHLFPTRESCCILRRSEAAKVFVQSCEESLGGTTNTEPGAEEL